MSVLLQNLAQLLFTAQYRGYPRLLPIQHTRKVIFITAIAVMLALQYLVHRTWTGKAMRALSTNVEAARLMGIRTGRIISLTFFTGSSLAAVGAVLYCLDQSQAYPTMGTVIGNRAFVAAVIGGIGNIPGAMLGGVLIGVIGELTKLTPYSGLQDVLIFTVLIAVLLVRAHRAAGQGRDREGVSEGRAAVAARGLRQREDVARALRFEGAILPLFELANREALLDASLDFR